jgi:hypothetical protein
MRSCSESVRLCLQCGLYVHAVSRVLLHMYCIYRTYAYDAYHSVSATYAHVILAVPYQQRTVIALQTSRTAMLTVIRSDSMPAVESASLLSSSSSCMLVRQ